MMKRIFKANCAVALASWLAAGAASAQTAASTVAQAFDHYEAIRVVLAQDKIETVSAHATALAPLAGQLAGSAAQATAERLASAKTINNARDQFAILSTALVPKFLEAKLPGVHAFMCPMKKASWAQRTNQLENPYYGKAMLTCGTEIK
jgi:hypothetical protein